MNKTVSIIFIILLSLLTIVVAGVFVLLLKGNFNFSIFGFGGCSENLVESKEVDAESIEEIELNGNTAEFVIEESSDNKIIVELYSDDSEDYSIEVKDNKIIATLNTKKNHKLFRKSDKILVKLPKEFAKDIYVNGKTGDVKVGSFENLKLHVKTSTGDIKADKIEELEFKLTTGDVKVDEVKTLTGSLTTGDIKVSKVDTIETTGTTGDVVIEKVNNKIDVVLTTGDVKIDSIYVEKDSYIKTSTGDVKIKSLSNAYVEASAKTGDVKVNDNDRHAELTLKINTTTGDIKVN